MARRTQPGICGTAAGDAASVSSPALRRTHQLYAYVCARRNGTWASSRSLCRKKVHSSTSHQSPKAETIKCLSAGVGHSGAAANSTLRD